MRVLGLLRPSRGLLILACGLFLLTTAAVLSGPWILRHAIDHGLTGSSPDIDVVTRDGLLFLGIGLSALVLTRLQTRLVARIGERFVRELSERLFRHVLAMPPRFFDRRSSGELVSRMTADVDALQLLVEMGMVQLVQSQLTLLMLAVALGLLSWKLSLMCLVVVPFVVVASVWFRRASRRAYLQLRDRVADTVGGLVEGVTDMREIQAMGQEDRMLAELLRRNDAQYDDANVRSVRIQAVFLPVMELLPVVASCLALGVGGWLVTDDQLTVGTLGAFLLYLQLTFEPIQSLSFLFNQVQSGGAALRRIFGVLGAVNDLSDRTGTLPPGRDLVLRNVGFRYDADAPPVLARVDLVVPAGEHLALVGPTGAGKSTLAKLVARFYDPTGGSITLGGTDLRAVPVAELRARVAMITQDGHLFDGTVRDNIRVARPAADDAAVDAVARIGADVVLGGLPQGLDTVVGHGGGLLSAGQRQLVVLARAALLEADVLILDEATSDLDPGTERTVTAAMTEVMRGRTVLVIAHRLSTILEADRIAVVAGGGIAELGTHAELLARGGRYSALHASWPELTATR